MCCTNTMFPTFISTYQTIFERDFQSIINFGRKHTYVGNEMTFENKLSNLETLRLVLGKTIGESNLM